MREVAPGDLAALTRLLGAICAELGKELPRAEQLAAQLARGAGPSHLTLVAAEGEQLLAYAQVHWLPYLLAPTRLDGYLSELFVHPERRGEGLGRRLLERIERELAARGGGRLTLHNDRTRASYQRAFYAKQGWTERPEFARFAREVPGAGA